VRIVEGRWPAQDEVLAGRLAYAKLGCPTGTLAVGNSISIEGRRLRISGRFTAGGSAFESELWCPLADLSRCVKRQDLSLVALRLAPGKLPTEVDLFCKERVDLELQAVAETDYYASLGRHYRPVRLTAWVVVGLIAGAGLFAGLNTMHGAVVGRVRELATLQAIGFRRLAILVSLVQEGALLGAAGSLVGGLLGSLLVGGIAVRFTMGAFDLRVDAPAVLTGFAVGLLLGVLGAVPPAMRAMRLPVAESLKAI
jgi:putative ABC transport system permease protein